MNDDAVNREAVLNIASLHTLTVNESVEAIKKLPPVQTDMLEQIRAEILNWEDEPECDDDLYQIGAKDMQKYVLAIIDKCIKESGVVFKTICNSCVVCHKETIDPDPFYICDTCKEKLKTDKEE